MSLRARWAFIFVVLIACAGCSKEPYLVLGPGVSSCDDYVFAAKTAERKNAYVDWVAGYLVARQFSLNRRLSEERLGGRDWRGTISNWLDGWCPAHPSTAVSDAAAALSDELLGR